ncbi:MAG TPA: helix-turn-helix domain-containing protein [Burkholderiales bacterium]|nr:helix-turn-helix domain-containing protein [Burkholderiales bacterium]
MRKVRLPANFADYNFRELVKQEKNAALKIRYLALAHLADGKTVLETADLVHKSNRMVHRWLNKLEEFGLDGLKDKSGRGRRVRLPKEKEAEFLNIILEFKRTYNKDKITGVNIQKLLKKHYDIDCTLPTAYNTLTRLNIKFFKKTKREKLKKFYSTKSNEYLVI